MKSESDKILNMLEEGTITAAEAEELLDAVEEDAGIPDQPSMTGPPPDMEQVRSAWQLPFNISLIITALGGSLLWRTRRATGFGRFARALILFPITIVAAISAAILYLSKNGPWLYMRIRSANGNDFALSLPFPLHWARGGLRLAQDQIPDQEVQEKLDAAADFLEAIETSNLEEPISIDIRDEGDSVEIYLA